MTSEDVQQADLAELLIALGMGDHARPQSPHEVFQEALGVLRRRLRQGTCSDEPPDELKRAIWVATLPFQQELRTTGGVTFMGLRNAVAAAVTSLVPQQPTETGDLDRPVASSGKALTGKGSRC